jgi:hypothetical protein
MSSKHFIWLVRLSVGVFLEFLSFFSIFRALKHFLVFLWKLFCTENIFRKKSLILPVWAEPVGPTQPTPAQ